LASEAKGRWFDSSRAHHVFARQQNPSTMSKNLRLSEKWFHRAFWLVALALAWFLIGLGNAVVGDLPKVEQELSIERFWDTAAHTKLQEENEAITRERQALAPALERTRQVQNTARNRLNEEQRSFDNWVATRQATGESTQNAALVERTRALDALKAEASTEQKKLEALERQSLSLDEREAALTQAREALEKPAQEKLQAEQRRQELRVFGYRLLLTLPLLVIAGWLFVKKRKSTYWPFVWGFIFFALFAFFVELVPYLPEYGGYVRYVVGIVLTLLVGRYAIIALNRYLEKQRVAEAKPDEQRRQELDYDTAMARLAKSVCPGCERNVNLKDDTLDFCPHCGIGLHNHCVNCQARKSTFARFCHTCGAQAVTV
jgi:predicted RNA-binding Zn-ribbon protein involved in translation (DUF1610 family)